MVSLQPLETLAREYVASPVTDEEGEAMFRAAVALFKSWSLTDEQSSILVDMPVRTYRRWKAGDMGRLSRDGKARLSNLMGIHKALRMIFRDPERTYEWISKGNSVFGGKSALDIMLNGELTDIMRIRRFLDSGRGGW